MKMALIFLMLIMLAVSGCSILLEQSERELAWTEIAKTTAHNQNAMTAFQIAALKAYMGDRLNELPATTISAIDEAEKLSLNYDPNTVTDKDLGRMYGLRARIFCDITRRIVGPELARYLP